MKHPLPAACALLLIAGTALAERPRLVVSSDIGGTDPDDFQSLVHLLVYADRFELEGLIASPYGPGRKADLLRVLDRYEADYDDLRTHSPDYPTPDHLRSVTKQGAIDVAPYAGYAAPTEGSDWLVRCARRDDPRPLHVAVWGGLEDLAQALHDAPDILPKLRVYWIGGPNKKWSPDAYQYLAESHPELWFIESNATYRGWFVGGDQSGAWSNEAFVAERVAGRGALGAFFATQLGGEIKMGDTPSIGWLLSGHPDDPTHPGWGGRYVRAWDRPHARFDRLTTANDRIEVFGVLELVLPLGDDDPDALRMAVGNQSLRGHAPGDGTIRFRFSPKATGRFDYQIGDRPGAITATPIPPDAATRPDPSRPNWWTDDPAPAAREGPHAGAKTVNRWRRDYLSDFAERMARCVSPRQTEIRSSP